MRNTFLLPCIMTMMPKSTIFFIFSMLIFKKFIISIAFAKLFHAIFTSVYIIIYILFNGTIVDIEKPDGICLPTCVVDNNNNIYLFNVKNIQ